MAMPKMTLNNTSFNFILNNIKSLQTSKNEMKWNGKMNLRIVCISHMVVQTLGASSFFGTKFHWKKELGDRNGQILILQDSKGGSILLLF